MWKKLGKWIAEYLPVVLQVWGAKKARKED